MVIKNQLIANNKKYIYDFADNLDQTLIKHTFFPATQLSVWVDGELDGKSPIFAPHPTFVVWNYMLTDQGSIRVTSDGYIRVWA